MFRAYIVDLNEIYPLIEEESTESIYGREAKPEITKTLEVILNPQNTFLNGIELGKHIFPSTDCSVFLSHSGQDKEKVNQFAQWLKKYFDINSFIDSDLWGNLADLQQILDDLFHQNKKNVSDYKKYSSAHTHMILCHALTQMIDTAECFIFLKSPESYSSNNKMSGTFSPWILYELFTMDTIRLNRIRDSLPPKDHLRVFSKTDENNWKKLNLFYPIALKRPYSLKKDDIEKWQCQKFSFSSYANALRKLSGRKEENGKEMIFPTKNWEKALNWLYENYPNQRS